MAVMCLKLALAGKSEAHAKCQDFFNLFGVPILAEMEQEVSDVPAHMLNFLEPIQLFFRTV